MAQAGIFLALGCALLANIALLCKHRGAMVAPDVQFRHPLRSAAALFASKWWTIGFAIATVAWGLHVAAMSLAPLSLVQAVIAGGLALLAIPARHMFGIKLGWRELAGLGLSAAGLAFLALTAADQGPGGSSQYSVQTMAAFEGIAIALGAALLLSGHRGQGHRHGELMLAVAAGVLIGVSNVAIKALAEVVPGDVLAIVSPWTLVAARRRRRLVLRVGAVVAARRPGRGDRDLIGRRQLRRDHGRGARIRGSRRVGCARGRRARGRLRRGDRRGGADPGHSRGPRPLAGRLRGALASLR